MDKFIYYVSIVIYNKECKDSLTCRQLEKINNSNIRVIIADNSTEENNNSYYCYKRNWKYINMNGNKGLSCAYNKILDEINCYKNNCFVIWADDDTEITENYFIDLSERLKSGDNSDIYAPIIYDNNDVIYSPNKRRFLKNKLIKSPEEKIDNKLFNAINSCLAVRISLYKNYRYDERIFMDCVDQKFCEDMAKRNIKFSKINVRINQNFFQRSNSLTAQQVWTRYKIRIHDFMIYANKNCLYRWLGVIKVIGWGVEMGIKCKSINLFIKCTCLSVKNAILLSAKKEIGI